MGYLLRKLSVGFLIIFSLLSLALSEGAFQGLDVYFVRHAETVANATNIYTEHNQNTFSKSGEEQIEELTKQLTPFDFDFICVSPKWRVLRTVLPYLKIKNTTAEIWPELAECCWQSNRNVEPTTPFQKAEKIILDDEMKRYFRFRDADADRFYRDGNYADGLVRLHAACDTLIKKFGGQKKSALIVGHGLAGSRMIEMLLGEEPKGRYFPGNARLWYLKEAEPGHFKLIRFNVHPSEKDFYKSIRSTAIF